MTADPTILITIEPNDDAIARIRSDFPKSEIRVGPFVRSTEEVLSKDLMIGAEILFCEVPPANFSEFDSLKWIQLTSHGYAQIFGLPLLAREIRVSNGLGTFDIPIAEWNIMMMLFWHRNMLEMLQHQKDCIWDSEARFQTELRGAVVGSKRRSGSAALIGQRVQRSGFRVSILTGCEVA